ncbi:MAG: glycosyltransferase family 1 protein [Planctomycetota bacterium]
MTRAAEAMRIGIDYRPALVNREGIGRYVRELVRGLVAVEPELALGLFGYTLAGRRARADELGIAGTRAELARLRFPARWLPGLLRRIGRGVDDLVGGADLFHHTSYSVLAVREAREVLTIHDCVYLHDADYLDRGAAERMAAAMRRVVPRARRILVPSEYVGAEVVLRLGAMPNRIAVTPLGSDHISRALAGVEVPPPDPPYVLTVSRVDNRKNHLCMLQAFERLVREGLPHRWVVAGPPGYGSERFARALAASPARARVEWRRAVPEAELPRLYAGAEVLLFASRSEGFGLPILEAMAAGTPVVTSGVASMPEVGGDAAVYVDPSEEEAIFAGLHDLLRDPARRRDLAVRGRARAAAFSWRETARKTAAAYRGALRPPSADGPPLRRAKINNPPGGSQ